MAEKHSFLHTMIRVGDLERSVAFEAGGTLLTDRAGCIQAADAAGLFLVGIDANNPATP